MKKNIANMFHFTVTTVYPNTPSGSTMFCKIFKTFYFTHATSNDGLLKLLKFVAMRICSE